MRLKNEEVVFNVFEATKYPQCYKVSRTLKPIKKHKLEKAELKVRQRIHWRKFILKGLLGVFRCKEFGPYIIQRIDEDVDIIVKDLGDSIVFSVKSKELRVFPIAGKALDMVS